MKKRYIKPQADVVIIKANYSLLTTSTLDYNSGTTHNGVFDARDYEYEEGF